MAAELCKLISSSDPRLYTKDYNWFIKNGSGFTSLSGSRLDYSVSKESGFRSVPIKTKHTKTFRQICTPTLSNLERRERTIVHNALGSYTFKLLLVSLLDRNFYRTFSEFDSRKLSSTIERFIHCIGVRFLSKLPVVTAFVQRTVRWIFHDSGKVEFHRSPKHALRFSTVNWMPVPIALKFDVILVYDELDYLTSLDLDFGSKIRRKSTTFFLDNC